MNLITVIIPYFKKKEFIEESLKSVLEQTYKNLEIIIVYDDESYEDLDFIKKIKSYDSRIILIINSKSFGAGESRNIAIRQSKGEYISFLDADDIWKKKKIEIQFAHMKKNNYAISHTNYEIIDNKRNVLGVRVARNFNNTEDLLKSCDIGLSTVMLKKELLYGEFFFPNLKTKEDFVLWLKLLQKKIMIGSIQINLTYWRKLDNSLSSSKIQKLLDGFRVYNHFMKFNILKSLYYLLCLSINFLKK